MILLTTLAPTNRENQTRAIESWLNLGYRVISFNTKSEIEKLQPNYNIEFKETENTGIDDFGRNYIRINAFTEWVRKNEDALLINSDIEIKKKIEIKPKENTLYVFSRNDYSKTHANSTKFTSGFDAFFLTKEFSMYVPQSRLVIGKCHWDYYLPMIAIKNGFELKSPLKSELYHKTHPLQYNSDSWRQTSKIYALELGLSGNPYKDSKTSHTLITSKIKYY